MPTYQSSAAKVRGFGAGGTGTHHFWRQRLTAVGNMFLVLFTVSVLFAGIGQSYGEAVRMLATPWVALGLILAVLNAAYHMTLGLQVVVEDYIHAKPMKWALLSASAGYAILIASIAVFSILTIAL